MYINGVLAKHNTRYQIDGKNLLHDGPQVTASPAIPKSFREKTKDTIEKSFEQGDKFRPRRVSFFRDPPAIRALKLISFDISHEINSLFGSKFCLFGARRLKPALVAGFDFAPSRKFEPVIHNNQKIFDKPQA